MVRPLVLVLSLLGAVAALHSQDLGRTDRLWHEYLSETVRRGLPLLVSDPDPGVVPFWPEVRRAWLDAQTLEPSADGTLLGTWIDRAEGNTQAPIALRASWPNPPLVRFSARQWGEALFLSWDSRVETKEWTEAWLAWGDKVLSPIALSSGITALEKTDPSAVVPLLSQAIRLYPDDRRFLPLIVRHPEVVADAAALVARDRTRNGGWGPVGLAEILRRQPSSRDLLVKGGYSTPPLESALVGDYGAWLASGSDQAPAPGGWTWDSDADGRAETTVVFQDGIASWSRQTDSGLWTLAFQSGRPSVLVETRAGASWTLQWEAYPLASTLEYRWGGRSLVYRFRPLAQSIPLWPAERLQADPARLPATLASLWLPLDPRALASAAATVETWNGSHKASTVFLYGGEVWLETQDTDGDGSDDTWSYFRSGRLASVYHDAEGRGQAGLRELYRKGELAQVQSRLASTPRNEFVLFPAEGVQLWDSHGDGRPLERLFLWPDGDALGALVFTKQELPWETMPAWESRP